jgi:carbon storage regulator
MLCLSRNVGESIVAGTGANQVVFTVIEVRGNRVRLGIKAASEIPVHRQEIYDRICAEQSPESEEKGGEAV